MSKEAASAGGHAGPERRKSIRRSGIDRRTMLRWEPDKDDRHQDTGRREQDALWNAIRSRF